jgi:hypothetical protein
MALVVTGLMNRASASLFSQEHKYQKGGNRRSRQKDKSERDKFGEFG